jgi:hypothetical protein
VLLEVRPLHFEDGALENFQFVELAAVDLFADGFFAFESLDLFEVEDEVFEGVEDVFAVDVGAVDDSDVVAGEGVGFLHVLGGRVAVGALVKAVGHVEVAPGLHWRPARGVSPVEPALAHLNYPPKGRPPFELALTTINSCPNYPNTPIAPLLPQTLPSPSAGMWLRAVHLLAMHKESFLIVKQPARVAKIEFFFRLDLGYHLRSQLSRLGQNSEGFLQLLVF